MDAEYADTYGIETKVGGQVRIVMRIFTMTMLIVGIMCLVLAGWSLVRGEFRDAIFGLALGLFLFWCRREMLAMSGYQD